MKYSEHNDSDTVEYILRQMETARSNVKSLSIYMLVDVPSLSLPEVCADCFYVSSSLNQDQASSSNDKSKIFLITISKTK